MKKTYNLGLLTGGIALILALVASFVLQSYFAQSFLTLDFTFDTFVLLAVAFILILQFKSFDKIAAIILVVYGAFNILYGMVGNDALTRLINSTEIEVLFILGLLLGHVLFEIAILFVLVHVTQSRFDLKFTKRFVIVSLAVSLVFLIAVSTFVTTLDLKSVLTTIFSIVSIGTLYFCIQQMVTKRPDETQVIVDNLNLKQQELSKLFERGIITQAEYNTRLSLINKE